MSVHNGIRANLWVWPITPLRTRWRKIPKAYTDAYTGWLRFNRSHTWRPLRRGYGLCITWKQSFWAPTQIACPTADVLSRASARNLQSSAQASPPRAFPHSRVPSSSPRHTMAESAGNTPVKAEPAESVPKPEPLLTREAPSPEDKRNRPKSEDLPSDAKPGHHRRSPERAIFVGNFPPSFCTEDIEQLFVKHGKVSRVDKKQNFAFVFMPNSQDAEAAIDELSGKSIGRPPRTLRVEWSRGDGTYRALFCAPRADSELTRLRRRRASSRSCAPQPQPAPQRDPVRCQL